MRNKLLLSSFLASFITLLAVCLLFLASYPETSTKTIFLTCFLPGFLICLVVSILFTLSYWQTVEHFFSKHVQGIVNLDDIDLISSWQKIIDYYEKKIQQLESTNQFTLSLMNQLTEGVLIFNQERRILFTNEAIEEMLSYPLLAAKMYTWEVLASYTLHGQIEQVIDTQVHAEGEFVLHQEGPRYLYYRILPLSTFIVRQDKAEYLLILQDLTHLRKLEKVRTEFVSNVSHELKSPIAAIVGFSETLISETLPVDKQNKYLKIIEKNAQKMATIIHDLLILSRLENAHQMMKKVFPLHRLLVEAVNVCQKEAQQKNIQVVFSVEPPSLELEGNESLLLQVFRNLIENAIRYSPDGTTVNIDAFKEAHFIEVIVQDQGCGIPAHEKERVFERFYRVDKSHSGDYASGSGLGLSIVKHIVLLHQGFIQLDSVVGAGSKFIVKLPVSNLTKA
ncbi:MAG: ATP-binding protein [Caldisericia bacterium]|nr:ATP-binding protein [Caldisericia bacterium]MDD4614526.1 ATP-binding protein [Caldisericia bacterium]